MTTLRPFRRIRQSVAIISLAAMLSSQMYLSAADFHLIRRADGLNSIFSYAERDFPLGLGDRILVTDELFENGAITMNAFATNNASLTVGGLVLGAQPPLPDMTGTITNASNVVTGVVSTAALQVGMSYAAVTNLGAGVISEIISSTSFRVLPSATPLTASASGLRTFRFSRGALTLQANSAGASVQTMVLGAGGIDMSASQRNLTINRVNGGTRLEIATAAAQTWTVGLGRTLSVVADIVGNHQLTLQNTPATSTTLGSGTGVISITGRVDMNAPLVINSQGGGAFTFAPTLSHGGLFMNNNAITINHTGTGNVTFSNTVDQPVIINNASELNFTTNSTGTGRLILSGNVASSTGTAINILTTGASGVVAELTGVIGGTGTTLNIVNQGAASVQVTGNNTFGGGTSVTGGGLDLRYIGTAGSASKLSDTGLLTLSGATLTLSSVSGGTPAVNGSHSEVVGGLHLGPGYSNISNVAATQLFANSITRSAGGVLNVGAGLVRTDNTNTNGILGGWAVVGSGTDWGVNAAGVINALGGATNDTNPALWTATQNVRISPGAVTTVGPVGNLTINSLLINNASTTTLSQTPGTTLTIDSGGLISAGAGTKAIGVAGGSITAGTVANAAAFRAGASSSDFFIHAAGGAVTLDSTIVDNASLPGSTAVGLVKTQAGTLILSADNTYTGGTIIGGGTVQLGVGAAGSAAGSLGAGDVVNNGTIIFNRNNAINVSNNISGSGGLTFNLATGVTTLSGTNTFRGNTVLTRGILAVGSAGALSPNSSVALGTDASAKLQLNGFNASVGGISGGGAAGGALELGGNTLTVGSLGIAQTYAGVISGVGGSIIKEGLAKLTLSGTSSTYSGTLTVNSGELEAAGNNALAGATVNNGNLRLTGSTIFGGPVAINGGALIVGGAATSTTFNGGLNVAAGGTFTLNGIGLFNSAVVFNQTADTLFASTTTSTFQSLTVNAGNVTLAGNVTGMSALNINGGSVNINRAGGVVSNTSPIVLAGPGTFLNVNETEVAGSLTGQYGSQVTVAAGRTLQIGSANTSEAFDGVLTGAGGVVKEGTGAWSLGGGNGFTGGLTISGGSVILSPNTPLINRPEMLSDVGLVTVNAGGSLELQGRTERVGGLAGSGNVLLGSGGTFQFGANGAATTVGGIISGDGKVIKEGSGVTTLTGINTFTGMLEVAGGTLEVANAGGNALSDTLGVFVRQAGSTFLVGPAGETVGKLTGAPGSILALNGQLTSTSTNSAALEVFGTATAGSPLWTGFETTAALPLSVGMRIASSNFITDPSWVVQISGSDTVLLSNPAQSPGGQGALYFTPVSVLSSNTSGPGGLTKNGTGALVITGKQNHSGDTVINAGEVQLGGFETGGRFVWQNVFSDQSQLVFGSTGSQIVNLAASATNLFTFERIGSLAGGAGISTSLNLVENSHTGVPTSANTGTLALGGDNKSSTFHGAIRGIDPSARTWVIKEGAGTFTYANDDANGFQGVARVEDGTWRMLAGTNGLSFTGTSLYLSNKTGAVFDNEIAESVDILSGGSGVRTRSRSGVAGVLTGNYLNQHGGEIKLTGSGSSLVVTHSILPLMTYSGTISGSGGLVKNGTAELTLLNANTYTGPTFINAGSLNLGFLSATEGVGDALLTERKGSLSPDTIITINAGIGLSFFNTNSMDTMVGDVRTPSVNASVTVGSGTLTITNASGFFRGKLTNSGGLARTGEGLANIGTIRITGGTFELDGGGGQIAGPSVDVRNSAILLLNNSSANGALADTTRVNLADSAVLQLGDSMSLERIGSLSGSGTVQLGADRSLIITRGGGDTYGVFTGTITGTGTSGLTLAGGSLVLRNSQTYTGATRVQDRAVLVLDGGLGVGTSDILPDSGELILAGATIRLRGDKVEIPSNVTFAQGVSTITRDITSGGTLALGTPTFSSGAGLMVEGGGVTTSMSNDASGILGGFAVYNRSMWAVKADGAGEQQIGGLSPSVFVNTLGVGSHTRVVNDLNVVGPTTTATLNMGSVAGDRIVNIDGNLTLSSGGIMITGDASTFKLTLARTVGAEQPTSSLTSAVHQFFVHQFNQRAPLIIDVPLANVSGLNPASFTKTGGGTVVFSAQNLQTGPITIGQGTLQVGNGGATGRLSDSSAPIQNDGILAFLRNGVASVSNPIHGSGALRILGSGVVDLSGSGSSYSGRTNVLSGTLVAISAGALGSPDGGSSVEAGALLDIVSDTSEPVALKGGTLSLQGNIYDGRLTVLNSNSVLDVVSSDLNFNAPILIPFSAASGDSLTITQLFGGARLKLTQPTAVGNLRVEGGSLHLARDGVRSGTIPGWAGINLVSGSTRFVVDVADAFRTVPNNITGAGSVRILSNTLDGEAVRQVWLTGNNTYSGGTSVGVSESGSGTLHAILHIGADSFTGSIGNGNLTVESSQLGNSQVRTHRHDTLLIPGDILLSPGRNANGTTGYNADFVRQGMGNVILSGTITSGPLNEEVDDPENATVGVNMPGPERALFTSDGSGRLIFSNATMDSSTNGWGPALSSPGPIAINNNAHIEFNALSDEHEYVIAGALGGGGNWVFNSPGTVRLNNQHKLTLGGWSGNVFIHKGILETALRPNKGDNQVLDSQLGGALDIFVSSGGRLNVGGDEAIEVLSSATGGVVEIGSSLTLFGGERMNFGTIDGGGLLAMQGNTTHLYGQESSYAGLTAIYGGGVARVSHLANNAQISSIGSGTEVYLGLDTSNGTLDFVGSGNDTTNRQLHHEGSYGSSATVQVSGPGSLTLTGTIFGGLPTALDVNGVQLSHTFNLAGDSVEVNEFSGNISMVGGSVANSFILRKAGSGTWRLTGARPTFSQLVQLSGGVLEIDSINALGNLAATRSILLNGGTLRRYDNAVSGTETFGANVTFLSTGGNSSIINDDLNTAMVINGGILQDTSAGASGANRTITLGGDSAMTNIVNGAIVGDNLGISKSGASTWQLNGANDFLQGGTISGGTLIVNTSSGGLGDNGNYFLSNANGILNIGTGTYSRLVFNVSDTIGSLQGNFGSRVELPNSGTTLTLRAGSQTFAGLITGAGGIKVTTNANAARIATFTQKNTYTGGTQIVSDIGSAVGGNRIDVYHLANGGLPSGIGASSNAAANLVLSTKTGGGGLRFAGFTPQSTDRLFTLGAGAGNSSAEAAGALWADGAVVGTSSATVRFTNTGAIAFTGTGNRRLVFRGGNRGTKTLGSLGDTFVSQSFNEFSPIIGDGAGGVTSIRKLEDSVWLLKGANTYTGDVRIERGTLSIGHNTALGNSAGGVVVVQSNNDTRAFLDLRGVTVTGEALTLTSSGSNNSGNGWGASRGTNIWTGTVTNNVASRWVVLNDPATPLATTALTVSGNIGGFGAITVAGNGTLRLSGNNSFTGQLTASGKVLELDYSTNNNSKLPNGVALILGGTGNVAAQGANTRGQDNAFFQTGTTIQLVGGSHTEIVNGLTLNAGASYIKRPSGTSVLEMRSLGRAAANGGTLDVEPGITTTTTNVSNGILGGYMTVNATDWATKTGNSVLALGTYASGEGSTNNINVTSNLSISAANTVRFNTPAPTTLTLSAATVLTAGGILITPNFGSNQVTIGGDTLTSGTGIRDIIVHQHSPTGLIRINSAIVNNGSTTVALTKSGLGPMILASNSTYTAGTFVNEGTLQVGVNGSSATLGMGIIHLNGRLIFDHSGADYRVVPVNTSNNPSLRGMGVLELAQTNTRTVILSGDNGGFQGTIIVAGGTLAAESHGNVLGNGRAVVRVTEQTATVDLRDTNNNTTTPNSAVEMYLGGRLMTSTGNSTLAGSLHITDAAAKVEVANGAQLALSGIIYSSDGLTKTGDGRLLLSNGNLFVNAPEGSTTRSLDPTLTGVISVEAGELWLPGGGRSAGATGPGNEIMVSPGATLDLRGAALNYGDDEDPLRKFIVAEGVGKGGTGALRNTSGTANIPYLEVIGDLTIGTGGFFNGARIDFNSYDISPITGSVLPGVTDLVASQVKSLGFNVITKVGTGDLVFRDTVFDQFDRLEISEGEVRFESNTPPSVGTIGLDFSMFNQIALRYAGPSRLDATNLNSPTGPILGSRLEFYRQKDVQHAVPILMDGITSLANGGANYVELNSDAAIPGPATFLSGGIEVLGPAHANIFNVESGTTTGVVTAQGNQTSEVQGKLIVDNAIYGTGGISKIGFREMRLLDDNFYGGETIVSRSGNIAAPPRSDVVNVNGTSFQNLGIAESWGEFGLTLTGAGRISSSTALRLDRNGLITLDNSTRLDASSNTTTSNLNDRINDAANVFLRMGTIRIIGSETTGNTEAIATNGGAKLNLVAGTNNIDLWTSDGAGVNLTLTIGELTRSSGAVLRVRNFDATSIFTTLAPSGEDSVRVALTTAPSAASGLAQVGSGASATSRSVVTGVFGGIAPHMIYEDTRLVTDLYTQGRNLQNATGSHFMTYDGGFLRPLDDSEYHVPTSGLVEGAAAGQNVNLSEINHFTRTNTSINSLRFGPVADNNATGTSTNDRTTLTSYTNNWTPSLFIDDYATLNVASGMIASATFGVGPSPNNSTFIRGGTLDFGTREGIISNQNYWLRLTDGVYGTNNFEIQSRITGSGGITKVGTPSVVFDAANNYTGVTTINEGILFARNGRSALGQGGVGNGISIQGTGELRLTNGLFIGSVAAPKDIQVGVLVNDGQQILRSENGNNYFYGDIIYDNVDSVRHANPAARPRVTANTNQALTIVGDIYGGTSAVTEESYYSGSRIITLEGAGFINIRGQIGDRGVGGVARAVTSPITAGLGTASLTNQNQLFRLHIASNQDLNVTLDRQYNAAGRLALDQGVLIINYDPAAAGNDGTGFWTTEAITKLAGVPVAAAAVPSPPALAELGNSNSTGLVTLPNGQVINQGNNGATMHGFGMGSNIAGAGNQAVFMTKPGQRFNMATWTIGSGGGYAVLGGLNTSGTVTYGTGQGTLTLGGRSVRFYAAAGGTVDVNYRLNGGTFIKNGLGTIVIKNNAVDQDLYDHSDTHNLEVAGGTLLIDYDGPITLRRVGNAGTFTGSGGTLIGRGFTGGTATARTLDLSTDTGATRTVRFLAGNTQVIAEAVGVSAFTLTMGNGSNSSLVTRSEGATAAFVAYNSTGGTGVAEVRMNYGTGNAHQNPKNHIIHWGVVGDSPRTATDFAMVDGNNNNRVRAYMRSLDEYKNDVATWLIGEDVSEDTRTSAGGSGFRGTLTGNLAVNTIRFDAAASSTLNVGSGQTLQVAQSGIMVSTKTGVAQKTITGGRLTSSTIVAGSVVSGSNVVNNLESTNGLYVGMPVSGNGIPVGTFISEIISATQVRMTSNATATTLLSSQGIVFGSTELVVHQYGQGNLVIESGLGDGNSFIDGLATTNGSTTITVSATLGIQPGMVLVGPNLPSGATVVSVDSISALTISRPATATASGGIMEVIPLRTGPASLAGGIYTAGQYTVSVASTAAAVSGMVIVGPGIPFGTFITSVNSATQLTLNNPVTSSASGAILYVTFANDTPGQPVTVTSGSSTLNSANLSVSTTENLRVGMGISGPGIPADAVIIAIPRIGSPDPLEDTNSFSISAPATMSLVSQTYRAIAGARVLENATTTASSSSITVTSTVGLISGMPVRLPHVAANATVNTVTNGTTFTVTGTPPSVSQSGLTGYAQYPGNMPAVLTGGVTTLTLGQRQLITVHSTKGLFPGLNIVGPNIPSGTVIQSLVDGSGDTQVVISKEVTGAGTDLTFVIGTQSAMPISMLAARVVSGSNKVMVASTRGLQEGLVLIGPGIPAAAVVTSIESSQGFTMSVNATATSTENTIRAVSPMALTINGPSTTGIGEAGTTGAVVLKSSSGNYGGKTFVNGGVLSIDNENSLGIASAVGTNDQLTLNGGTLRWTGLNGQLSPTRGLTIAGNGGVIDIAESTGLLFIKRSIFSQDQYRGDLIKTGPGSLVFEGDSGGQANFRGLLDIREGTVRMAGDDPTRNAGTATMFGSNISWADGTIVRSGANLMIQMGNANGNRDWNFEEFIRFEGNNVLTVGTPNGPRRPVNWAGIIDLAGGVTIDVTMDQVFRLGYHDGFVDGGAGSVTLPTAGGQVIGSGDIIKDGMGNLEFRENIPEWKGGLTILQGRVTGLNQGDVFGTGHLNGKMVTLGSTEHAEEAELFLQADLSAAGSVWESNMPINVVYNPAQTKSIGVLSQPVNGMDFRFTGNVTMNDNLILNYIDTDNASPAGGEYVHIHYTGDFADGAITSGNLVLRTREGAPNANNATNGRMHVFHRFSGNNTAWTGDMVIGENLSVNGVTGYNHDQTTIARLESNNALGARNDVIMNYNTVLQIAGSNVNIGSLHTLGGDGPFTGNVGTMSGSHTHSSEIIENAASTPATITINQSTPVSSEVKWDAMFRDGTLISHWVAPGQGDAAASLSIVKAGSGWATLSLDNEYTGTTTVAAGILQVGAGGIGDTGAIRAATAPGLTVNSGATLAGTGVVHGLTTVNGLLKPGDVAGGAIGTINVHGNLVLGNTSVTTIQVQAAAINVPELLNVPLDANGQPDFANVQFVGLYEAARNLSLGATDAAASVYQKDISDPVYSNHHDQVRGSGNLTISDSASIILTLEGYTPIAGDVFRVLQFASLSAASGFDAGPQFRFGGESGHDLNLPALGGSFMWDTSLFKTRGIVSVIGIDNAEIVTVLKPIYKTRPQHTIVELNTPVTFEAEAFGTGNITYTWKKGTAVIGTGPSFTTAPVTTAVIGKYLVEARSDAFPLSDAPSIAGPVELAAINMTGSSFFLQPGGTRSITVTAYASSASVLKYQWMKDGVAIANGSKYAGVTTKTLTLKAFSANEAGNYTCRVYIPASSSSGEGSKESGVHQAMLLSKPEFETDLSGNLVPPPPAGQVSGAYGPYQTPVKPGTNRAPTKYTATGLPTGLKIDSVTGVISGVPDLEKTWTNIKITASNAAGSTVSAPFSIVISPLPNTAVGAFVALADRDATAAPSITFGKGARIDLTTTKKGTFTLKFTNGTVASSAKGRVSNLGGSPTASVLVKRKAPLLNLTVTFALDSNNIATGTVTDGVTALNPTGLTMGATTTNFNGWRNVWSSVKNQVNEATTRYGNHNLMAEFSNADVYPLPGADRGDLTKPQGVSTGIVKVVKPGKYTAVFRMGDSTAVASIAAPLGPTGQLLFYRTIYSTKQQGTVHGLAAIAADPFQTVTGNMTWSKPAPAVATVAKLYHNGWPAAPLALTIAGGRYFAPLALKPPTVPVGEIVMSLPAQPDNAKLSFEYGKAETASLYPNLTIPFTVASTAKVTIPASNPNAFPANPNPAALKMTSLNAATGEFVGSAILQDLDINTGKTLKRTLSYRGLIIPNVNTGDLKDGIGVGHFTLQEMPVPLSPVIQNAGAVEFDVAP